MSGVFVQTVGTGTPVVLVHGSLATGREEWLEQQPLAEEGYALHVLDRRGYGRSPAAEGEDFLRDAEDVAELMDGGAHLVGHSYGGLGALVAAARRPEAALSLTLLEPPVFSLAQDVAAVRTMMSRLRALMRDEDRPDGDWVQSFLGAVGTDPDTLPPDLLDEITPLVPVLRRGRTPWDAELPLAELASASVPTLVVTGGHSAAFDAVCDELADRIGATRSVVAGAGHEIQLTGEPINRVLLDFWRTA